MSSPRQATTLAQQTFSEGCSDLNDPYYDGFYGSSGNRNHTYLYDAGERIVITAGPPDQLNPTTIALFDNSHGGEQVATRSYPGTLTYIVPSTGDYNFGWTVFANATFAVSCEAAFDPATATPTLTATATVTPTVTPSPTYDDVEIVVRAFIPCEAVQSPTDVVLPYVGEVFGGDRPPIVSSGSYRAAFSYDDPRVRFDEGVLVTTDPSKAALVQRTRDRFWTATRLFTRAQTARLQGPWWCWGIIEDTPIEYIPATIGSGDSPAQIERTDEGVRITIAMHAGNAYPPLGVFRIPNPIVDGDMTIEIRQPAGEDPEYRIYGSHDGFPAYEIYVNTKRVYECDPLANGDSPRALYPPQDKSVAITWTTIPGEQSQPTPARCSTQATFATVEEAVQTGSTLGLVGSGLLPSGSLGTLASSQQAIIAVNDTPVGSVPIEPNGTLEAILNTTGAAEGTYTVTATLDGQRIGTTHFRVDNAAPRYMTAFEDRSELALTPTQLWLPLIVR